MPHAPATLALASTSVPRYLDLERWPRKAAFDFFRGYDNPYFNVCASLDATLVVEHARAHGQSFSLACVYLALRTANGYEPFRYRLEGGRVLVHDVVHGATATLLDDERLAFVYFDYHEDFARVEEQARRARAVAAARTGAMDAQDHRTDLMHFSSLPWIEFTGLSHARNWRREDSVPKITFGRYHGPDARVRLPISVEVHHALLDGLHVGRFLERLQENFSAAPRVLGAGAGPG